MRSGRHLVLVLCIVPLVGACGVIAGLDSYELDLANDEAGVKQQGRDGSTTANGTVDGSSSGNVPFDSGPPIALDGSNVTVNDGGDGSIQTDTGPASDAACKLTANGQSCSGMATNCCSMTCQEQGKCTGNSCDKSDTNCSNDLQQEFPLFGSPYVHGAANCCVGLYCKPSSGSLSNGKCSTCVPSGEKAPVLQAQYYNIFDKRNENEPVYYDDACCSLKMDNDGTCR